MTKTKISGVAVLAFCALLTACENSTGPEAFAAERASGKHDARSEAESSDGESSSSQSGATTNVAAHLRLRCELRTRGRSKISVDGNNLVAGMYSAVVSSGQNTAAAALQSTIGDEVEFDFDSDPEDIAAGANAISADFIQTSGSPHVTATILDQQGQAVVSAGGNCDIRR